MGQHQGAQNPLGEVDVTEHDTRRHKGERGFDAARPEPAPIARFVLLGALYGRFCLVNPPHASRLALVHTEVTDDGPGEIEA